MERLCVALYHAVPITIAAVCNMVFLGWRRMSFLNRPIDCGTILPDGQRLFGSNKTWKGLVGSLFFFSFWHGVFEILYNEFPSLHKLSLTDYQSISGWVLGLFVGFAASVSELPNSFIKRRCRVLPGKQTGCVGVFFDQADSVIGVTLVFYLTLTADLLQLLALFLVGTFIHTLANILDSCVGLKRRAARSRSQLDKSSSQDELAGPDR